MRSGATRDYAARFPSTSALVSTSRFIDGARLRLSSAAQLDGVEPAMGDALPIPCRGDRTANTPRTIVRGLDLPSSHRAA